MTKRVEFEEANAVILPPSETSSGKKPFIAPKISVPVDVLEATTFFQSVESGVTN